MNNVKLVTKTIALTFALATTASLQAAELVKVEVNNHSTLINDINIELAQSVKTMSLLSLNVEKSAETILVAQNKKQSPKVKVQTQLLVASAE
jgi:hypothetical protein